MNTWKNLIGLVGCVVSVGTVLAAEPQGAAVVVRLNGLAQEVSNKDNVKTLGIGDVLKPGAIVETSSAKDSFVDLVLVGNATEARSMSDLAFVLGAATPSESSGSRVGYNVLRLWPGASVGISKLASAHTGADEVNQYQLELNRGHVSGLVKKVSGVSQFSVRLPDRVVDLHGGSFDISESGVVSVGSGSVTLGWQDPSTGTTVSRAVSGGQQLDARRNLAPLELVAQGTLEKTVDSMRVALQSAPVAMAADVSSLKVSPVLPPGHGGTPPGHGGTPPGQGKDKNKDKDKNK